VAVTRDRADVPADDVARLYQAGWTVTRIAARYGAAASTVLRRLDDAGVARRPRSVRVWFPVDEAARRVQQEGASLAQLARDYQVGVDAVRGQLAARGIHAPPCTGPRVLRGVPAAEIVGLYATGLTMTAIAGRYGVSPDTIRVRLLAAGVTPRRVPARPAAKPIPVGEAAMRYRRGATLTELGARYAVTARTVRRQLIAAGVTLRSRAPGRIPVPVEEAAQLYTSGQTMRQLAQRYGVCETVIYNRLTEAGVPLRRKTGRKQVDPALLGRLAQHIGLDVAP
jgi:transposase-like protein